MMDISHNLSQIMGVLYSKAEAEIRELEFELKSN